MEENDGTKEHSDKQLQIRERIGNVVKDRLQKIAASKEVFRNFSPSRIPESIRRNDPTYLKPGSSREELRGKELSVARTSVEPVNPGIRKINRISGVILEGRNGEKTVPFEDIRPIFNPDNMPGLDKNDVEELRELIDISSAEDSNAAETDLSVDNEDVPDASSGGTVDTDQPDDSSNALISYIKTELEALEKMTGEATTGNHATGAGLADELKALVVPGPADQPSIHEFTELRIAFSWIWSEMFDDKVLIRQARELYTLLSDVQIFKEYLPREVSDMQQLEELLDVAQELANGFGDISVIAIPQNVRDFGLGITLDEWREFTVEEKFEMESLTVEYRSVNRLQGPTSNVMVRGPSFLGNDSEGQQFSGNWFRMDAVNYPSFIFIESGDNDVSLGAQAGILWVRADDLAESPRSLTSRSRPNDGYTWLKLPEDGWREIRIGQKTFMHINLAHERAKEKIQLQGREILDSIRARIEADMQREASADSNSTGTLNGVLEVIMDVINRNEYAFKVFPEASINFGLLLTYRQEWNPLGYQVGDLMKTIPLAPKEIRRYKTRIVEKRERCTKEIEKALSVSRDQSQDTTRVETEIVRRAQNNTNFKATAEGRAGIGIAEVSGSVQFGTDSTKESSRAKRNFREAVIKAGHEYKQNRSIEIVTTNSEEIENTTSGEISNPNEEITVTYLFYELGRKFRLRERLCGVTPVVLVGNIVPKPSQLTESWLIRHDWILKRVILDDSFLPTFRLLRESNRARNVELGTLKSDLERKRIAFDEIKDQLVTNTKFRDAAVKQLRVAVDKTVDAYNNESSDVEVMADTALTLLSKGLFGSNGLFGIFEGEGSSADDPEGAEARQDAAEEALERLAQDIRRIMSRLEASTVALDAAILRYTEAVKSRLDKELAILRLRTHIMQNILHYMQAIWEYEPTDQRYLRLHDIDVPIIGGTAQVLSDQYGEVTVSLSADGIDLVSPPEKKLVEVADLDRLLGFKGNYTIFQMRDHNYVTAWMAQDYLNGDSQVSDPDTALDLNRFEALKIKELIQSKKLKVSEKVNQFLDTVSTKEEEVFETEVVVPTGMLYIEALPGSHPILENFKLVHRQLDVRKVSAEIKREEIENIRRKSRLLTSEFGDADIDKVIHIKGMDDSINVDPN